MRLSSTLLAFLVFTVGTRQSPLGFDKDISFAQKTLQHIKEPLSIQVTNWTLMLLPQIVDKGAVCLDGSPPGIYYHQGDPNKWVVHIMGGGWCVNEQDCLSRSQGIVGSSKFFPQQPIWFGGIVSNDPNINPHMFDWTFVYIPYCDGASFAGNNNDPIVVNGTKLYFRGVRILEAVIEHLLYDMDMDRASEVVVTGFSAGGLATYLHLDHLREIIPAVLHPIRVVGMPDAGFFMDHIDEYGSYIYTDQMQYVFNMQNASSGVNQACLQAHSQSNDQWKCFMAPYAAQYITTPFFIVNHLYDPWQLTNIWAPLDDKWYQCTQNGSLCSTRHIQQAQQYHLDVLQSLKGILYAPGMEGNGAFTPSCFQHICGLWDYYWAKTLINGRTMYDAFWNWYTNNGELDPDTGRYISFDVPWPGNPACPKIPAP